MDWTFWLCDRLGAPIEDLTPAVTSWSFQFRLNRPTTLKLAVPSDHDKVSVLHTDSRPRLAEMRTLKCFRGAATKTLRANLYVWTLNDRGEGDAVRTEIVCMGPGQRLSRRLMRDAAGAHRRTLSFASQNVGTVFKTLVERTNTHAGVSGVLADASTTVDAAIAAQATTFEYRTVGDAMVELATNLPFDFEIEPLDRTDGYLGRIHFHDRLGTSRPTTRFGYQVLNSNCSSMERNVDMTTVANDYHAHGGRAIRKEAVAEDATSQTDYGMFEDHGIFDSITLQAYLNALALTAVVLRKRARELVKFTPAPDAAEPWTDFVLGDTFDVAAGARLRGGFTGVQRCYGFDLAGGKEGGAEQLTNIYTSPE